MAWSSYTRLVGAVCLVAVAWGAPAPAQTNLFRSGSLTWDTTTANWGTATTGPYTTATWTNAAELRAVFEGTAGTATLGEAITAHSLRFDVTGWTVTGNTLTLGGAAAGAGTVEVAGTSASLASVNSALAGGAGLTKTGGGVLAIGAATTYTGTTTVNAGTLRPATGVNNVFNPAGAFVLANASGVILSLASTTQAIGSLAGGGTTGGTVTLGTGTLTVGGDNTSTTYAGTLQNSGTLTKVGTGTLTLTATSSSWTGVLNVTGGTVSVPSGVPLNTSSTADIVLNGGTLQNTNPSGTASSFVGANRKIVVGANGGTVDYTSTGSQVTIYSGTILGPGNTLTKTGTGEFRYQNAGTANSTFSKLVVSQGLFRLGSVAGNNFETGFGAAPAAFTPDAITLNGGAIGTSFDVTLNANRGITLGANGGSFTTSAAAMTVPGAITGPGALNKNTTGTLTLSGASDYAGGTLVTAGTLVVANTAGSGTGTGAVTVNAGGTLAGTGTIAGATTVNGGGTVRGATGTGTGTLTFGNDVTVNGAAGTGGAVLATQLTTSGGAVTANSKLALTGATSDLNLVPTAGKVRLTLLNDAGLTSGQAYTLTLATAADPTNFQRAGSGTDPFTTADFDVVSGSGAWPSFQNVLLERSGAELRLTFTPVPEPATVLGVAVLGLGAIRLLRRRRT